MNKRLFQLYVVTPAVFCSVILGGGYGTGREVVEYFTQHGPTGGLLAIGTAAIGFFVVLLATFELARQNDAHDYRTFFTHLLGKYWWLYEVLYLTLFVLVIGVIGAAVQELMSDQLGLPGRVSMVTVFMLVIIITLWGRTVIERLLTFWAGVMFIVFFSYLYSVGVDWTGFTEQRVSPPERHWALSGLMYAGYNIAVLPVLLFTVRGLTSRRESTVSALLTAVAICLPAVLFHLSYVRGLPNILSASLPNYWMINHYGPALLLPVFTIALTGTLVETASGLIHGFIERVVHSREQPLVLMHKLVITLVLMMAGGLAGEFGVIQLIAIGYSAMAVGFLLVYVLPVMFRFLRQPEAHLPGK